jgi:hypothetical protein
MRKVAPSWVFAALTAVLPIVVSGPASADASKGAPSGPPGGGAGKAQGHGPAPALGTSAQPNASSGGAGANGGPKVLHSIPEDGMGTLDLPASSRLVREIVAVRRNEDLIICIAGCRPGFDRVVYAQPSDPQAAPKPVPVTDAAPANVNPDATAGSKPETVPSEDKKAAEVNPAPEAQMVPTSSDAAGNPASAPAGNVPASPASVEAAPANPAPGTGEKVIESNEVPK